MSYETTENKDAIRRSWDLPLLRHWQKVIGQPLTYFGLAGPEIHDFLDWAEVLDSHRTTVEELGRTAAEKEKAKQRIARLSLNLSINGMSSNAQILRGKIEDIILEGYDTDVRAPRLNDGASAQRCHFLYDLVNLDFDGGVGYVDKSGTAARVQGIKRLFERQEGHSFVLLLTVSHRDTLDVEVQEYLAGMRSRDRGPGWQEMVDWYLSREDGERDYRLKATITSFIHAVAEPRMFDVLCRPPVAYQGFRRARMVHFAFELRSRAGNFRTFSAQDDRDVLGLPLMRVESGALQIAAKQHPGFDVQRARSALDFLDQAIADELIGAYLSTATLQAA